MASSKPTVMVIGTVGTGKSTTMQRLSGSNEEEFISARQPEGCTQHAQVKEFNRFKLIDTPGLNDMRIPSSDWGTRYNESDVIKNCKCIDLVLILFRCKIRPDVSDFNILAVLMQVLESVKPKNCALVFTFADQDDEMDHEYAIQWYDILRENEPSMPAMTQDRVWLFKGRDSNRGPATTTEELHVWIESMLPAPGETVAPKEFSAESYQEYCQNSRSDLGVQAHSLEFEMLKAALKNQEAQTKTMQYMMQQMQRANEDQRMSMIEMQEKMSHRMDEMVKAALEYR